MNAPADGDKYATTTRRNGTQRVRIVVVASGPQHVNIDTHGLRGEPGSYISVTIGKTIVTITDMAAALTYVNAWIDLSDGWSISQLVDQLAPSSTGTQPGDPAVSITAHGRDSVKHSTVTRADHARRRTITAVSVRIGAVNWIIEDRQAARAHLAVWRQVRELAPHVLGKDRGRRGPGSL